MESFSCNVSKKERETTGLSKGEQLLLALGTVKFGGGLTQQPHNASRTSLWSEYRS